MFIMVKYTEIHVHVLSETLLVFVALKSKISVQKGFRIIK